MNERGANVKKGIRVGGRFSRETVPASKERAREHAWLPTEAFPLCTFYRRAHRDTIDFRRSLSKLLFARLPFRYSY